MRTIPLIICLFLFAACNRATQVSENVFVYGHKVYKLIDNELKEVADLNSEEIRKVEVLKPTQKSLGTTSLDYIKASAETRLDALYRGNTLYFKLYILGLNDLKEDYTSGIFTVSFLDEFGFILHSTEIATNDLTGIVDNKGNVTYYQYNGKTEMSTDINSEIKSYSVSSTVKKGSRYW